MCIVLFSLNLDLVPLVTGLEPERKVFGVLSALSVGPERQVDFLDRQALARRGVDIAQLQASKSNGLANDSNEASKANKLEYHQVLSIVPEHKT